MVKTLFVERDKNILISNIILYGMMFLALAFPVIVYYLTNDFFFLIVAFLLSVIYIASVQSGLERGLSFLNAKKIEKEDLKDIKIKQLVDLVEELKIAAGYPGEITVYIIEHPSINAMAMSRGNKAIIGVTRGALEKLNREELSGVIGHEIAHIVNRDSDVKFAAFITLGILAAYLRALQYVRVGDRRKNSGYIILLIIILAILSYVLGLLMFFLLSRKRETLADVESVRLNRNKYALIKALEKIKENEKLDVPDTASGLFFANPLNPITSEAFFGLFRTHPPIDERIKYLKEL